MENKITKATLLHEIYLYGIMMLQDTEDECVHQLCRIDNAITTLFSEEKAVQNSNEEKLPQLRAAVYDAINSERYYQEQKWGILEEHQQSVGAYLTLMRVHLSKAESAWAGSSDETEALAGIRKVLAIGVACGEQHELPKREQGK